MLIKRALAVASLSGLLVAGAAGTAQADHTHVMKLGNGQCVILAANGGEKYVQLPHHENLPENRRHPLHVNVHLGEAGERQGETVIWVQGSPAGNAACAEGYVND